MDARIIQTRKPACHPDRREGSGRAVESEPRSEERSMRRPRGGAAAASAAETVRRRILFRRPGAAAAPQVAGKKEPPSYGRQVGPLPPPTQIPPSFGMTWLPASLAHWTETCPACLRTSFRTRPQHQNVGQASACPITSALTPTVHPAAGRRRASRRDAGAPRASERSTCNPALHAQPSAPRPTDNISLTQSTTNNLITRSSSALPRIRERS